MSLKARFLLSLIMLGGLPLRAQYERLGFEHYSVEDGLSFSKVLAITMDAQGFMWFGTQYGLNRFNGYSFEVFHPKAGDESSLSDSYIRSLLVDSKGNLWVGTANGLNLYNPKTGKFTRFKHNENNPNSISGNDIWALCEDSRGTLWVGTLDGGLCGRDPDSGVFTCLQHEPDNENSLSHSAIRAITEDHQGNLWIGTRGGLNRLDPTRRQFKRYLPDQDEAQSIQQSAPHPFVFSLLTAKDGTLWVGTFGGGLFRYLPDSDSFEHFKHQAKNPHSLSGNRIWALHESGDGRIWVGTLESGLNRLDPKTGSFTSWRRDAENPDGLHSNMVWSLFEDSAGSLWVGTNDQGIHHYSPKLKQFAHFSRNPVNPENNGFVVVSMCATRNDRVLLGTWSQGILAWQPQRGWRHYPIQGKNPKGIRSVLAIDEDRSGTIWAGVWGRGLARFERGALTYYSWQRQEGMAGDVQRNVVTDVFEDSQGQLWVASFGEGLFLFDRKTEEFTPFTANPENNLMPPGNRILALKEDHLGYLWVGTIGDGLAFRNPQTGVFTAYRHDPGNPNSLGHNRITCISETADHQLWVGTEGGGLNRFNRETSNFKRYTEQDGLASNLINGIMEDGEGVLWLSSNRGIMSFDVVAEKVRIYGRADGVQAELNAGVYCRTKNGDMYFGGTKGFNRFNPNRVVSNDHIPPLVFTGFRKFGKTVEGNLPIHAVRRVDLNHRDDFIEFDFAALDYLAPQRNRYAVKLEGFNKDWIELGTRRTVNYTNLKGGTYKLRVKGSNNDGLWNEQGSWLMLVVHPPFWETWWFQSISLILLAGLVVGLTARRYRTRIARVERHRDEMAEIKTYLAEGREAERLFVARELHDGPVQNLHALQLQMSIHKDRPVRDSGLSHLVGEILRELRHLCGQLRPPVLAPFGLAAAIRAHTELIRDRHPDLDLHVDVMDSPKALPEKTNLALFRIFQEALNNALNHAAGNKVRIRFEWDAEHLLLEVEDNGRGLSGERDPVKLSKKGHYGLLGIAERVEVIGGTLAIHSQPERGTRLRVTAPSPDSSDLMR